MGLSTDKGDADRASATAWSDEELTRTIDAYLDMQEAERRAQPVNKAKLYRELGQAFGRSPGAFERRMQNISAVLAAWALPWIPGLKPLRNVGAHVQPRIESMLRQALAVRSLDKGAFEPEVVAELLAPSRTPPAGHRQPAQVIRPTSQFVRDLEVKAWVLKNAQGRCECCGEAAPFETAEGIPYLEVHHLKTLASGGSDTVNNAVATCPNCHRRLHYSQDAEALRRRLLKKIDRLQPE